ncbi:MAG: ankyrin repeat domain-containing protein [Aureispira sp.]|nr:ankyrin repeat domain-containing protein [Aureispira sp.]
MSGGDWKEMLQASQTGNIELVKYHIRMGIDPNYQHPEFFTAPLLESIRFGHLDIAKFLLENGAEPNIKEVFDGSTPLSIAKMAKNREAIELLKAYDVVDNEENKEGRNIEKKDMNIIKKMLTYWRK